ncbi:MAG: hypothetical protein FWF51_02795 [Chitinivibrionia bacterium]|nr:hypothetical protein [Chitinivibrionia bacterium]
MKINITENAYNRFVGNVNRVENSPIREANSDFWDVFKTNEADISENFAIMNFIKNIDTRIYA